MPALQALLPAYTGKLSQLTLIQNRLLREGHLHVLMEARDKQVYVSLISGALENMECLDPDMHAEVQSLWRLFNDMSLNIKH